MRCSNAILTLPVLCALLLTVSACSGGPGAAPPPAQPAEATKSANTASVTVTISAASASALARKSAVAGSLQSVKLVATNGSDVSQAVSNCTASCTLTLQVTPGSVRFDGTLYDQQNAAGNVLGTASTTTNIVAGQANNVPLSFSLSSVPARTPLSGAAFVDSIGVNIHVSYTETPYATNWAGVLAALSASGIKHVRDGFVTDSIWTSRYVQLKAAGIDVSVVTPINTALADMQTFVSSGVPIGAWESPNELDMSDANYAADLAAWEPTFYARAKSLTPNVPVAAPALSQPNLYQNISDLSASVDKANTHVYAGGRNVGNTGYGSVFYGYPWGTTQFYIEGAHQDVRDRTKAVWFTETGDSNTGAAAIPEPLTGRYVPRTSLWNFLHGVERSYFYEFLNEDRFGSSSPESGFGLVHSDLTPKPAFTVLAALIAKCSDAAPPAVLSPFPLTISGTPPSDVTSALFQKSGSRYVFVIWRELPSWDPVGAKPIAVSPTNVALQVDATRLGSSIVRTTFDDSGTATQSTLPLASDGTATISADDHVQTLEFTAR